MGAAMRTGLAVLSVIVSLCAERSRARADEDPASPILIHPGVATVLEFPDAIVHTWLDHHGDIRVARIRDKLYIRPRPGTPAGVEASLEVETGTARWTFRLLVVARARDARRDVQVPLVDARAPEETPPGIPAELAAPLALPAGPVAPPPAVAPGAAEPAESAPTSSASSAPPEPIASRASVDSFTTPVPKVLRPSPPELSVHAIGALGFTALDVAGYGPFVARQSHLGFGVRLRVARPDAWWSVEANIIGERLGGPLTFAERNQQLPLLTVKGTWLKAEVSMRVQFGTKWIPSVSGGLGMQAHLRRTESSIDVPAFSETMPRGAVFVFGIGLHRRAGDLLLGFDFQAREGGPDGYHSVGLLWTVGCFLDPD